MTERASIAAALVAFQAEMPTVKKSQTAKVPTKAGGSYSYTYAGLADVMREAMPILTRHGIAFTALPHMSDRGYELVGTLIHTSGESIEGALPIAGNTPQEMGSSLTYMRRYLFGCLTGLVTDDDDDGHLAQKSTAARKAPAKQAAAPPPGDEPDQPITAKTRGQMFALFGQKGIAEDDQLPGINHITGKGYGSRGDVTEADAREVIRVLKQRPDAPSGTDPAAEHDPTLEPGWGESDA